MRRSGILLYKKPLLKIFPIQDFRKRLFLFDEALPLKGDMNHREDDSLKGVDMALI